MNYNQAKRAVAAKFGDVGLVKHARREKKDIQYRVFLKATPRPVCIGAGRSWKRAVEMAMKAEVTQTPEPVVPTIHVPLAQVEPAVMLRAGLAEALADAKDPVEPVDAVTEAAIAVVENALPSMPEVFYADPKVIDSMRPEYGAALDAAVAEAKKPWVEHAVAAVKTMALNPTFTSDDVWDLLDGWGLKRPADSRALGQVMQKLRREGLIRPTGQTVPTRQKSRRRAPIAVWVGTQGK